MSRIPTQSWLYFRVSNLRAIDIVSAARQRLMRVSSQSFCVAALLYMPPLFSHVDEAVDDGGKGRYVYIELSAQSYARSIHAMVSTTICQKWVLLSILCSALRYRRSLRIPLPRYECRVVTRWLIQLRIDIYYTRSRRRRTMRGRESFLVFSTISGSATLLLTFRCADHCHHTD